MAVDPRRRWLGAKVVDELAMAVDYWESPETQDHSQGLESMFHHDGSNLRVEVQTNELEGSRVQIREFTQTDPDEPIEAIVSDLTTSILARFNKKVVEQFKQRWRRPITSTRTLGSFIQISQFEIILPQFSSTDDDPIFLTITECSYLQSEGTPLCGQPTPIKDQPEMRQLLRRFHKNRSGEHNDADPGSDDDLLSQAASEMGDESFPPGAPHTSGATSQTQLGTQVAFSQAAFPPSKSGVLGNGVKTEKAEPVGPSEQLNVRQALQPKQAAQQQLLALLHQNKRGANASEQSPMPPPPPPRLPSSSLHTPQAESPRSGKELPPAEEIESQDEEPASANSSHEDDDTNVAQGGDDQVEDEVGLGAERSPSPMAQPSKPQDERPATDAELVHDNQTPTSYQIPVVSSSTVPTTNSSIPSVLDTREKDVVEASQKQQPFMYHASWRCVLPVVRSVCRIPQDQAELLKKPNSFLPSPVGCRFPVGNVPKTTLMSIATQAEERSRKGQTIANKGDPTEAQPNIVGDALPSLDPSPPDAMGDGVLGSQSPSPTQEIPWSSSPIEHHKRMADLPPDSSLPEEQAEPSTTLPDQVERTEDLLQEDPEMPSSPPTTSSQHEVHGDPLDEAESDLETSVPTAYTKIKQTKTTVQEPTVNPRTATMRDVSSSGRMYTHLHRSNDPHAPKITVPLSSSLMQPATQPPQTPLGGNGHTSLPTSTIPCSIEASQPSPSRTPRKIVGFDGAAESKMQAIPDEDALIDQQIQNEMDSQSSRRQSSTVAPVQNGSSQSRPLDMNRGVEMEPASAERSPTRRLSRKREAPSPSTPSDSRKRTKKLHTNYHFSQDSPVSEDPLIHLREQRRQFYASRMQHDADPKPLEAEADTHANSHDAMDVDVPAQEQSQTPRVDSAPRRVPETPSVIERTEPSAHTGATGLEVLRRSKTPEGPANGIGASSIPATMLKKSEVSKSKTEAKGETTNGSLTGKQIKHRLYKVQKRLGKQSTSTDGKLTNEQRQMLEEQHNLFQQAEKHGIVLTQKVIELNGSENPLFRGSDVEMDSDYSSSGDSETETQEPVVSLTSTNMVSFVPQIPHEDHDHHDQSNDVALPPAEQNLVEPNPQQIATNDDAPKGEDATQPPQKLSPPEQAKPSYSASEIEKPEDVFNRFSEAYPEYTGNRVHFENLCGQVHWLRKTLPRFAWDDYIVRSKLDYKKYTDKCTNEGIDPLPWYRYYVDEIPMPNFMKGIMNPTVLQNLFDEVGKASIVHKSVPRVEQVLDRGPPPETTSRSDNPLRGDDSHHSDYSQPSQRTGANNIPIGPRKAKQAKKRKQKWKTSPIRQQSRPPAIPSAAPPSTSYPFNTTMAPKVVLHGPSSPTQVKAASTPAKTIPPTALASKIARPVPQAVAQRLHSTPVPVSTSTSARAVPQTNVTRALTSTPAPASRRAASVSTSTRAAPESTATRTLSGMPLPPPPLSTMGSGKKGKSYFQEFKEKYNRPRPGGSRAGSMAP